jgi:hypothetical protein
MRDMGIKSSEEVREEIRRVYDRDPKKWHVLLGRDSRGYSSTIFIHKNRMWMLKEELLNPYESIGCGISVKEIDDSLKPFLKNPHSFGFRPISEENLKEILETGISYEDVRKLLNVQPVKSTDIDSPVVVGPVTLPSKPIDFVSKKQRQLDIELSRELDRMIFRRRPDIFTPYV